MHECLKTLWNKAWFDGHFISEWKRENRVIIPKVGKKDYNRIQNNFSYFLFGQTV